MLSVYQGSGIVESFLLARQINMNLGQEQLATILIMGMNSI